MSREVEIVLGTLIFLVFAVPTLLFYGWIAFFGWLSIRALRPGRWKLLAPVYAALALAPLGWYGAVYYADVQRNQALIDTVSVSPGLPRLASRPRVLVVHAAHMEWQDRLVEMGAFDEIYLTERNKTTRLANARREGCATGIGGSSPSKDTLRARTGYLVCATETPADAAPADGLHFHLAAFPSPQPGGRSDWQMTYDLRWIEGGVEKQVGFFGRPQIRWPVMPPVLSPMGFEKSDDTLMQIVPWHGEVVFLVERLGITPDQLKPLAQPSPEDIRTEFLRRRNSPERADQNAAGYIATSVGSAALSAEDIAPLLSSNVVDQDFARELGFQQFCGHIDRLCDFPDLLIAACKAKRDYISESTGYRASAIQRCERIPAMCNFCRVTPPCQRHLTGSTAGCSREESAARDEALRPIREN